MILKILPSALDDLENGWLFYEGQQAGLGDYFQDSLFSDIDSLILFPGAHRMLSKRFPYAVYYKKARLERSQCGVSWICVRIRNRSRNG